MAKCDTTMGVEVNREIKRRRYCREICTNPNNLVHMLLGQIAFELRVPLVD